MDVVLHLGHAGVEPTLFSALHDQYFVLPSIHKLYNGMSDHLQDKFNVHKWRFWLNTRLISFQYSEKGG
jgi:hypothetical protein